MYIYLIGASNPETIRMIAAMQRSVPNFEVLGFLDNDRQKKDTYFFGYPVPGGTELVPDIVNQYGTNNVGFVNLITGSTIARYEVSKTIISNGGDIVNFIHPSVDLTMSSLGQGNYIQEGVIIQAGVVIGDNNSIHMGSLIGHESTIGSSIFIAHGASISGCCVIGDGTFIGTNSTILPRIRIGKWATIGAGAVVTSNVPDYAVVVGNPAKSIRQNEKKYMNGCVY